MRIALYQPEIPGNVGTILRLSACMGIGVDIIEPTGFVWNDARLKRATMDYAAGLALDRHSDWATFCAARSERLVLLSTRGGEGLSDFVFAADDILLFGRESSGVPEDVAAACGARVRIPMAQGMRSLNVSVSAGIALFEALRQTGGLPA